MYVVISLYLSMVVCGNWNWRSLSSCSCRLLLCFLLVALANWICEVMSKAKRAQKLVGKTIYSHGQELKVLEVGVYPPGFDFLHKAKTKFLGAKVRFPGGATCYFRLSARLNV